MEIHKKSTKCTWPVVLKDRLGVMKNELKPDNCRALYYHKINGDYTQ